MNMMTFVILRKIRIEYSNSKVFQLVKVFSRKEFLDYLEQLENLPDNKDYVFDYCEIEDDNIIVL